MDSNQSISHGIPIPRAVKFVTGVDLPHDYSSTPGGTFFSTTPGGTRIIYERKELLQMRNSPVASTPPRNLPQIPGVTKDCPKISESPNKDIKKIVLPPKESSFNKIQEVADDTEFQMEL